MDLKKLALATAAGTTLLATAPAFAQARDWERDHDRRSYERYHQSEYYHHRDHRDHRDSRDYRAPERFYPRGERVVVVPAAPVYYAPSYTPPSRPVISGQIPIGRNANLSFDVQL